MQKKNDDNYIYNVGGNERLSLIQLSLFLSKINKKLVIENIDDISISKIDIGSILLNSNKLTNKIGKIQYTPIYEGLRKTYNFYKNNLEKYL